MKNIEIPLENLLITLTVPTIEKMLKHENGADLIALYVFYNRQAKIQETNQTWSNDIFVRKGLHWGVDRLSNAKKLLIELGLIEIIRKTNAQGKVVKWYLKLNYIIKQETLNKNQNSQNQNVDLPECGFQETNALSIKDKCLKDLIKTCEANAPLENQVSKEIVNQENKDIIEIIDEFRKWNPAVNRLYANKTQRYACEQLLKTYGKAKVISAVAALPRINSTKYTKKSLTPLDLWNNWISYSAKTEENLIVKI